MHLSFFSPLRKGSGNHRHPANGSPAQPRRAASLLATATAGLLLCGAAPASAATASLTAGTLTITDQPGHAGVFTIGQLDNPLALPLLDKFIVSANTPITPAPAGCSYPLAGLISDTTTLVCSRASVSRLALELGDGDDVVARPLALTILGAQALPLGTLPMTVNGGAGADSIQGGDGADIIDGGDGDDHLFGFGGDDTLTGGLGNDTVEPGLGHNTVDVGTPELDTVIVTSGSTNDATASPNDVFVGAGLTTHITLLGLPVNLPATTALPTGTPAPTATPASTSTPTATPTGTPGSTVTPAPTATPASTSTPTATPTGTPGSTVTPAPTGTPAPATTPTATATPTPTALPITLPDLGGIIGALLPTPTPAPATTPAPMATATATATPAPVGTATPSSAPTPTPTPTPLLPGLPVITDIPVIGGVIGTVLDTVSGVVNPVGGVVNTIGGTVGTAAGGVVSVGTGTGVAVTVPSGPIGSAVAGLTPNGTPSSSDLLGGTGSATSGGTAPIGVKLPALPVLTPLEGVAGAVKTTIPTGPLPKGIELDADGLRIAVTCDAACEAFASGVLDLGNGKVVDLGSSVSKIAAGASGTASLRMKPEVYASLTAALNAGQCAVAVTRIRIRTADGGDDIVSYAVPLCGAKVSIQLSRRPLASGAKVTRRLSAAITCSRACNLTPRWMMVKTGNKVVAKITAAHVGRAQGSIRVHSSIWKLSSADAAAIRQAAKAGSKNFRYIVSASADAGGVATSGTTSFRTRGK